MSEYSLLSQLLFGTQPRTCAQLQPQQHPLSLHNLTCQKEKVAMTIADNMKAPELVFEAFVHDLELEHKALTPETS